MFIIKLQGSFQLVQPDLQPSKMVNTWLILKLAILSFASINKTNGYKPSEQNRLTVMLN